MLNELTGLLNNSQINNYKTSVYAAQQYNLQQKRINCIDTFISNQNKDFNKSEMQEAKKLFNKPNGDNFSEFLKKACEALKKK